MELYKRYSDRKKPGRNTRRFNEPSSSFRNSRDDRGSRDDRPRESTTVTCADCRTECQVPFVPRNDKPVYCSDCFRQNKPQDSGNDRYSRDDRGSRYSRDDRNSRYSRDDRGSRDDRPRESTTVTCADCGTKCQVPFVPRNDKPVYCSDCFRQNKPQDSGSDRYSRDDRNSRYSRDDRPRESTTVTCADCRTECQVPFVPRNDKPVYCSDCFRQHKPQDSGNDRYSRDDRGSRYSRDDRGSRYSRDDRGSRNSRDNSSRSRRDDSRPRRSSNDKFLKKQESFFSDGSEKFYASLKEKLFEILGGKVCSSCGFKDEKALGFSHKFDSGAFDDIRRGGAASSWGKYISEPELAKQELDVLCLNCNEIRQPVSKPKEYGSNTKPKKNRRFPR